MFCRHLALILILSLADSRSTIFPQFPHLIRTRSHIGPANPDPSVTCSALRLGSFASNLNLNASPHLTLYACRFKVSRAKEVIASVLKQVRALLAGWALGKDGPFGRMGPREGSVLHALTSVLYHSDFSPDP